LQREPLLAIAAGLHPVRANELGGVHFCDEAAPLARAAAAQDHAGALGALHDADDATGGIHGDQCCPAAHGGHVLQSLMSQEPHALAVGPFTRPRPSRGSRASASASPNGSNDPSGPPPEGGPQHISPLSFLRFAEVPA
jgi:hypothetical protein